MGFCRSLLPGRRNWPSINITVVVFSVPLSGHLLSWQVSTLLGFSWWGQFSACSPDGIRQCTSLLFVPPPQDTEHCRSQKKIVEITSRIMNSDTIRCIFLRLSVWFRLDILSVIERRLIGEKLMTLVVRQRIYHSFTSHKLNFEESSSEQFF